MSRANIFNDRHSAFVLPDKVILVNNETCDSIDLIYQSAAQREFLLDIIFSRKSENVKNN